MAADLEFIVLVSYLVEVLSDIVVKALAISIGVEMLADVNVNVSAAVITALEFPMPMPSKEFSFLAGSDCQGPTLVNCEQAKIPWYHV